MPVTITITADSAQAAANLQQFARVAEQSFNQTAVAANNASKASTQLATMSAGQMKSTGRALSAAASNLVYTAGLFAGPQVQAAIYPLMMIGKEAKGISAAMKLAGVSAPVAVAGIAAVTAAVVTGVSAWAAYEAHLAEVQSRLNLLAQQEDFRGRLLDMVKKYENRLPAGQATNLTKRLTESISESERTELAKLEAKKVAAEAAVIATRAAAMAGWSPAANTLTFSVEEETRLFELRKKASAESLAGVAQEAKAALEKVTLTDEQRKHLEHLRESARKYFLESKSGYEKERLDAAAQLEARLKEIKAQSEGLTLERDLEAVSRAKENAVAAYNTRRADINKRELEEQLNQERKFAEEQRRLQEQADAETLRLFEEQRALAEQIKQSALSEIDPLGALSLQEQAEKNLVDQKITDHQQAEELKTLITQEYAEKRAQIERQQQEALAAVRVQQLQGTRTMFDNMAIAAKAFGAKGFAAYKAFAIAGATVETYQAAIAAYKSVVGIPYVGPALAPVAAAAAIAAGMAQVAAISAQSPGYQAGGFTGTGTNSEPAGVVHRNEWVMPADTVQAWGHDRMAAIQRGPAHAAGGGSSLTQNLHVYFDKAQLLQALRDDMNGIALDAFNENRLELGLNT